MADTNSEAAALQLLVTRELLGQIRSGQRDATAFRASSDACQQASFATLRAALYGFAGTWIALTDLLAQATGRDPDELIETQLTAVAAENWDADRA